MIREVFDADTIEHVVSDHRIPGIFGGHHPRSGWRYFGDEKGLIVFVPRGGDTWEAHMLMPNGGASKALQAACEAMYASGARELIGAIHEHNHRALRAALRAGCQYIALQGGFHHLRYDNGRNR